MDCPSGYFSALAASSQGKRVFAGTTTGWICAINTRRQTAIELRRPIHSKGINHIAVSRESILLVTCSDDATVAVVIAKQLFKKRSYTGSLGPLRTCAVSNSADMICAAGDDMMLHLWMTNKSEQFAFVPAHSAPITSVQFSTDGDFIVSCSADGLTRLWAIYGQEIVLLRTFMYNGEPAVQTRLMIGGDFLITKYRTGELLLFEVATGKVTTKFIGRSACDVPMNFVVHALVNSKIEIISVGLDGDICAWNFCSKDVMWTLKIPNLQGPGSITTSYTGKVLAYVNFQDKRLFVFKR